MMPRKSQSREERADALMTRIAHVPRGPARAMAAHLRKAEFKCGGVPAAMEEFFARLHATGQSILQPRTVDFEAVATSRTRLYTLLYALETFAPQVPLAAALPIRKAFDAQLNATYNKKPPRPHKSRRISAPEAAWPDSWKKALPTFAGRKRIAADFVLGRLGSKTKASIIQAVGMAEAARQWAADRDVHVSEAFDDILVDVFARFLLVERGVSIGTAADYIERVRMFAERAELIDDDGWAAFSSAIAELRSDAAELTQGKVTKVRAFEAKFSLADILIKAHEMAASTRAVSGFGAKEARVLRDAVVLALLVNGCDRQGDLSRFRIGHEIFRNADGSWSLSHRQRKTCVLKEIGCLWPPVSVILDAHVLGDRPTWDIDRRLQELDGVNLLSLGADPFHTYLASKVLREIFGISAHLIRTLVTDFLRRKQPDAGWAVQALLGHTSQTMQGTYQTDFREVAAVRKVEETIFMLAAAQGLRPRLHTNSG